MEGSRQGRVQSTNTYRADRTSGVYVQGNTVLKPDFVRELETAPKKKVSASTRKNREKAIQMNLGYVIFLAMALFISGMVLVGYIQLQFSITNSVEQISTLESQLNTLRLDNEENYNRITSNVNLEEVKRIAIEELGMTYASEGQIVTFSGEGSDYVRQYAAIP